jgi:hypothetical protein
MTRLQAKIQDKQNAVKERMLTSMDVIGENLDKMIAAVW